MEYTKREAVAIVTKCAKEDIRDITMNQSQVLAILQKRRQEKRYRSIKYVAKGLNLLSVRFPEEIADLLQICDKKNENAGNT